MFFKRQSTNQVEILDRGNSTKLTAGDSFGLLPDLFWFCIQDETNDENRSLNENPNEAMVRDDELGANGVTLVESDQNETKASGSNGNEAGSSVQNENHQRSSEKHEKYEEIRVKDENEPNTLEHGENGSSSRENESRVKIEDLNETPETIPTNAPNCRDAVNNETASNNNEINNQNASSPNNAGELVTGNANIPTNSEADTTNNATIPFGAVQIKKELLYGTHPSNPSNAADQMPAQRIKTEPVECHDEMPRPRIAVKREFKTEIETEPTEPDADGASSSAANTSRPTQRACCKFGVRCYRYFHLNFVCNGNSLSPFAKT